MVKVCESFGRNKETDAEEEHELQAKFLRNRGAEEQRRRRKGD